MLTWNTDCGTTSRAGAGGRGGNGKNSENKRPKTAFPNTLTSETTGSSDSGSHDVQRLTNFVDFLKKNIKATSGFESRLFLRQQVENKILSFSSAGSSPPKKKRGGGRGRAREREYLKFSFYEQDDAI